MQGIVPQGEQNSGIELTNAFARRKFARRQEKGQFGSSISAFNAFNRAVRWRPGRPLGYLRLASCSGPLRGGWLGWLGCSALAFI